MKRIIFILLLLTVQSTYAFDMMRIVNVLSAIAGTNLSIEHLNIDQLNQLQVMSQGLLGMHTYGSLYGDLYPWRNTDTWQQLLQSITNQYLANDHFNSPNEIENAYYRLQVQTTLASRSSSELIFDQVTHAARTIEHLQAEIDRAKDAKSAIDLNNRFSSEQAHLHIQQTQLLATLVQQMAVDAEEKTNRAKEDASFFNYR